MRASELAAIVRPKGRLGPAIGWARLCDQARSVTVGGVEGREGESALGLKRHTVQVVPHLVKPPGDLGYIYWGGAKAT
jgi:hypothetical protein